MGLGFDPKAEGLSVGSKKGAENAKGRGRAALTREWKTTLTASGRRSSGGSRAPRWGQRQHGL